MIGDIIRTTRIKNRIGLRKLSETAKIDVCLLSRIERKTEKIKFPDLEIICFVLKLDIKEMRKEWEEENQDIIKRNQEASQKSMDLVQKIIEALKDKKPGENGKFLCDCGGVIVWQIHSNGHIWALCDNCKGGFIQ